MAATRERPCHRPECRESTRDDATECLQLNEGEIEPRHRKILKYSKTKKKREVALFTDQLELEYLLCRNNNNSVNSFH